MTGSASNGAHWQRCRQRLAAALAGMAAGLAVLGAQAQPVQLLRPPPESVTAPVPAPVPGAVPVPSSPVPVPASSPSPAAPPAAPPASSATPVRPGEPGVLIQPLQPVDTAAIGTLHDQTGGLGIDLWAGTPRALVTRLLPLLPVSVSPAMQSLTRRLLLTSALAPQGEGGPDLLTLRIERLLAAGQMDAAAELARLAGPAVGSAGTVLAADAAWIKGQHDHGCSIVQRQVREDDSPIWLKASVFCRALQGAKAEAALALSLLRDQGIDDPAFVALADALLAGKPGKLDKAADLTPLHLAMVRETRTALPEDAVLRVSPSGLPAVAGMAHLTSALRLAAAERAEALGVLPATEVARQYAEAPFTETERKAEDSLRKGGPRAQALLYQIARAEEGTMVRAESLLRAWELGRERGLHGTVARAHHEIAAALPPEPELLFVAAGAIRAAVTVGDLHAARRWLHALRSRPADLDPPAAQAAAQAWGLLMLADDAGWDDGQFGRWLEAQPGSVEIRNQRAVVLLALAEMADKAVPQGRWQALYGVKAPAGEPAGPGILRGMQAASAAGRRGETVLHALVTLGPGGPGKADPAALKEAVTALEHVGLDAEARQLVVEAALAHGF